MKKTSSDVEFVEYDDSNISHVEAGPTYGQFGDGGWGTEDSFESFYKNRYTFNGFSFRLILS